MSSYAATVSVAVKATPEVPVCIALLDHEKAKGHMRKLRGRILPAWLRDEIREIERLMRLVE
ncbi:hypothetical protein [Robbsia andropogonis]|uniref:hypothetical protein n=1 Tax=Robbsia andropogonis TaxID=28092 RepID=UPI002A69A539|nr:hypothetical protein [Robbsia andropogonis]